MRKSITIVFLSVAYLCPSCWATIINVPDDYPTIQQGINASSDGDTVLVQPDTYVENINFNDHSIVLGSLFLTTGDTSYISTTIIDGNSSGSVVTVAANEDSTTTITGFTIRNGSASDGGGIYFHAYGITLSNLIISNNTASYQGGGIFIWPLYASHYVNIFNCTISGNSSDIEGGGIYSRLGLNCSLNISGCLIENNECLGSNGKGGGIYTSTPTVITNSAINDNFSSYYGGGIYIGLNQNTTIDHCIIAGNSGAHNSGIYMESQNDTLVIANCTISNNHSFGNLGAMRLAANCTVRNCIVSGNTSDGITGGIYFSSGGVSFNYGNIYNNYPNNFAGSIPSGLGEMVDVNANGDSCDVFYNILLDPLFVDPDSSDFHLLEGSPCIDAGDPNSPYDPDGTICDMGAFYFDHQTAINDEQLIPSLFMLSQNYPNPFNAQTTIRYSIPGLSKITIEFYNILGRRVESINEGMKLAGVYQFIWDAADQPSGVYFYRIQAGDYTETKRMVLLK